MKKQLTSLFTRFLSACGVCYKQIRFFKAKTSFRPHQKMNTGIMAAAMIMPLSLIKQNGRVLCLNVSLALLSIFLIQQVSIAQSVQELPIRATINTTNFDASVVGGQYPSPNGHAYLWIDGSLNQLPLPENASISSVSAIANNANVVAGWVSSQGSSQAVKWVDGEYLILPSTSNIPIATDISDDGSIVLGGSSDLEMWIHSERVTLPLLGGYVRGGANAMSGDGSRIVGYQVTPGGPETSHRRAVLWENQQPIELGTTGVFVQAEADAISQNGEYIAGYATTGPEVSSSNRNGSFFISHNGTIKYIGLPSNHSNRFDLRDNGVIGISNDGKVVVGRYPKQGDPSVCRNPWGASFVWTENGGIKDFEDFLADEMNFDIERPLFIVRDLSPDGHIAVATASHCRSSAAPIRPLIIHLNDTERELIVNSTSDHALSSNATTCATGQFVTIDGEMKPECTLRAAIQLANSSATRDSVSFNIPDDGPHTIQLTSALPALDQPLIIDATTQEGYNGLPLINLRGNTANAFIIKGGESTIRGFSIGGFSGTAIRIEVNGGNVIQANHIGTDASGNNAIANLRGVNILHSPDNIIGGSNEGEGNVISGNIVEGVYLFGAASKDNVVAGNRIGTNRDGTAALPNRVGVRLENSPENVVGGATDAVGQGPGNLISGNTDTRPNIKMEDARTGVGVLIDGGSAKGNIIQGNVIGTDYSGQSAIGNGLAGVYIYNAPQNRIGGDDASQGNLISGNVEQNIQIFGKEAVQNTISGNTIGPNIDGTASLSENAVGVGVVFASRNRIGGQTGMPGSAPGNLISGNGLGGVLLAGINPEAVSPDNGDVEVGIALENLIAGNLIGTTRDGTSALPNRSGVAAIFDAHKTQIGGDQPGYGNVISGNEFGVILADTTGGLAPHESVIAGNFIGTTISGNEPLGNENPGIMLTTLSSFNLVTTGIAGVRIGGTAAASRNIVAANRKKQIEITGPASAGTVVMNNYIGVLADGKPGQDPEESEYGIFIFSPEALIGVDYDGNIAPNIIGGNENGIGLLGSRSIVMQNKIGTNPAGTAAVANNTGIWVLGDHNVIYGNTISGNTNYGVQIGQEPDTDAFDGRFFDPEMTTILRNNIGTDSQAKNALGNGLGLEGAGVMFWRGKSLHMYLNVLSGNHHGVHIANSHEESGTRMAANFIGAGGMIPNEIEDVLALPEFVPIPNQGDGVHITDGRVYLTDKPENELLEEIELGNFIQNNMGAGIRRTGSNMSADLEIKTNLFFGNTGLGIDIGPEGVGAGGGYPEFPVLLPPVFSREDRALIRGTSPVSGTVQLFSTPLCHSSGHGEARTYFMDLDQQVSGGSEFSVEIANPENLKIGFYVTALLTNGKRTSEFSKCMRVADEDLYVEKLIDQLAEQALELVNGLSVSMDTGNNKLVQQNSIQNGPMLYAAFHPYEPDHSFFDGNDNSKTLVETGYWSLSTNSDNQVSYNACVDLDEFGFTGDPHEKVIYHRHGIGSPWIAHASTYNSVDGTICATGFTSFGDLALGSGEAEIGFIPFITTWKTDNPGGSEDNQIRILMIGNGYEFTVDWGDGSDPVDYSNSPGEDIQHQIEHTYSEPGTYTVSISGDFPRIYFDAFDPESDHHKIMDVVQWGDIAWQSMKNAFFGASNLIISAEDAPDLSGVEDMGWMFRSATSMNSPIGHWDTSNITRMDRVFRGATSFNQPLDGWTTDKVTTMAGMFYEARAFNQDLNHWNTEEVTDMNQMFRDADAFNVDITGWDTGKVENFNQMFRYSEKFNQPIGGWDTGSATNMGDMFFEAEVFNQDISEWNISNVTSLSRMFSGAVSFNQSLGGWDISHMTGNMTNLLDNTALSVANFDDTLIKWAELDVQNGVTFGAAGLQYCNGADAHAKLVGEKNWTITDAGISETCGDAPEGEDQRVLALNNAMYTFSGSDFGLSAGQSVKIVSLPTRRDLNHDVNDEITFADLNSGDLTYDSESDQYGYGYDLFEFSILDSQGTESEESYTMTIDLAATFVTLTGQEGWRFISPPTEGETVGSLFSSVWTQGFPGSNNPNADFVNVFQIKNFFGYEWAPVVNSSAMVPPDIGTIVYVYEEDNTSETFPKIISSSNQNYFEYETGGDWQQLFVDASQNEEDVTYFLLGNFTPFAQDFCEFTRARVADNITMWDPNINAGAYTTLSCSEGPVAISPFQAFWIRVQEDNPELGFDKNSLLGEPVTGYFKQAELAIDPFIVSLDVTGGSLGYTDRVRVLFSEEATDGLDLSDAPKLAASQLTSSWLSLYARDHEQEAYAVRALPIPDRQQVSIPIGIETTEAGSYTFTWNLPGSHHYSGSYYLMDHVNGTLTELIDGHSYQFEIEESMAVKAPNSSLIRNESKNYPLKRVEGSVLGPGPLHAAAQGTLADETPRFELILSAEPLVEPEDLPTRVRLAQNYPNPFNPSTIISYELPEALQVRLDVYDITGRHVVNLVNSQMAAGRHQVTFNAMNLSSGVYLYRLQAGSITQIKKLMVLK